MFKKLRNTRFQRADSLPNKIAGCFVQFNDDLYLGGLSAVDFQKVNDPTNSDPSPMSTGVGPLGRIYIYDCVPITKDADGLAEAQAVAGAGNLTLAGALCTAGVGILDVPRAVSITSSSAGDTTQTATVTGTDLYGAAMSEAIAFNGAATISGKKAFKRVTRIAISAALAGNGSAGSLDVFGMPLRVPTLGYLVRVGWDNVLADDAATGVKADATTATTTTGDVRGTIAPSSAADGTRRLVVALALTALAVGPNATRAGALGVTQA